MTKFLAFMAALAVSVAALAQTSLTVSGPLAAGTYTVTPVTNSPPPVLNGSTFWIYQNGAFKWAGDFSWCAGTVNYQDTVGNPGGTDIAVPIVCSYGGYQPYAPGKQFDTTPYKYLTYSVKPTKAGAKFATVFHAINDADDGVAVEVAVQGSTKYGPPPAAGHWTTYKVPLADFGLTNKVIQKFTIADSSGASPDLFYVDNVGFTVN